MHNAGPKSAAGTGFAASPAAADWLVPQWPAPAGVHALCTTRTGGVSLAPYAQLNLGAHVGDAAQAVAANREVLRAVVQSRTPGAELSFLNQVHGWDVAPMGLGGPDGTTADACTSTQPGAVCTVMVADCLPVLLTLRSGAMVGAAHAGWRGLAGQQGHGVLEAVFERFSALAVDSSRPIAINEIANESLLPVVAVPGGEPASTVGGGPKPPIPSEPTAPTEQTARTAVAQDLLVWLGPCIGPEAFEVGAEVRDAFCAVDPLAAACFVPLAQAPGKFLADLAGLARRRLQALGVPPTHIYGNNSTPAWCTVTQESRFFSHRRDAVRLGASGRFAACIWRG